jgi:hypothetical protein
MKIRPMASTAQFRTNLPQSLHRDLAVYALAAGAAGVGVLALAQPADAEIVYTPTHLSILGPRGFYKLDLNHDGVVDFTIANTTNYTTDQAFWDLFAKGPPGNSIVGTFVGGGFPASAHAFFAGAQIGPGKHFFPGAAKLASFYYGGGGNSSHGNWVNVTNRYLGVKFQIGGQTHYGWARFTVKVTKTPINIFAELTGYAYETVPDKPIVAGDTGSGSADGADGADAGPTSEMFPEPQAGVKATMLGALALGSSGLAMWRRP